MQENVTSWKIGQAISPSWKNTLTRGEPGLPRIPEVRDGLITTMLFLLIVFSLMTPLNILTIWLLPLPFLLQTAKNGWVSAVFPILLIIFSFLAVTDHLFYPGAVLLVATAGVVMGVLYRRPDTSGTDVVLGGLTIVGISLLILMMAATHYFDLQNRLNSYLAEEWQRNAEWFRIYGVESATDLIPYVATVIPSVIFMLAVPVPLFNLVVARKWLTRRGLPGKYLPPFREWRLPRSFFYFYLVFFPSVSYFRSRGRVVHVDSGQCDDRAVLSLLHTGTFLHCLAPPSIGKREGLGDSCFSWFPADFPVYRGRSSAGDHGYWE